MTNRSAQKFSFRHKLVIAALLSVSAPPKEVSAQIRQPMKVQITVSPSVAVKGMDAALHASIAQQLAYLNQSIPGQTIVGDSVIVGPGLSISAFENISVLISVKTKESGGGAGAVLPRILCGYLNDGTTYFRRSTITDKDTFVLRLLSNNLLKRSMKLENPLFVAYVFFLVQERRAEVNAPPSTASSTVTVEFL